jgi:hypothetical protein
MVPSLRAPGAEVSAVELTPHACACEWTRTNYDVLNVRTVRAAAMVNVAGNVVAPGSESFLSAMNDFADRPEVTTLFLGMFSS